MSIRLYFCLSHLLAAVAGLLAAFLASLTGSWTLFAVASSAAFVLSLWIASRAAGRSLSALSALEEVVTDNDACESVSSGLREFDETAIRIGQNVARWEGVAAKTREQTRDFKAMMLMLNDRGPSGEATSVLLRDLLSDLGNSLHTHLSNIHGSTTEIRHASQAIAEGSEIQNRAIMKATSHAERLAATIDSISSTACTAKVDVAKSKESVSSAFKQIVSLSDTINRVRRESQACEKKVRGLCDPSRQISAIVATIGEITSKTDLLALNASIESIRAGEHGSGFALVADEVRKLAEQAADANREIANIIESMQVVTQEALRSIQEEREEVDSAANFVASVKQLVEQICTVQQDNASRLNQIASDSDQQLQIAQDLIVAVEQISKTAIDNRGSAEKIRWTIDSLAKSKGPFDDTIERLRNCSTEGQREELQLSKVHPLTNFATVSKGPGLLATAAGCAR